MDEQNFANMFLDCSHVVGRTVIIYLFGIAALRIGKSRSLSRATVFDALLILILGSLLGRGITGAIPLSMIFVASITLVGTHWLLSLFSARSHHIGDMIKGRAIKLVTDGKIDWDSMRHSHLSEHDLLEEMRLNANVEHVKDVASAYKERSGAIGIVRKDSDAKVLEVTVKDGVQTVRIVVHQ